MPTSTTKHCFWISLHKGKDTVICVSSVSIKKPIKDCYNFPWSAGIFSLCFALRASTRKGLWDKGLPLNLYHMPCRLISCAAYEDYKETKKNDSLFWSHGTIIAFSRSIVWTEYSECIFKKWFLVIWGIWQILWSAFGEQIQMPYLSFGAARTGTDYLRTQIL